MSKSKTALSIEEVKHIAKLANLVLKEKEVGKITRGLSETLDFINKVKKINTKGFTPLSHVTGLENIFRNDEIMPSLSQKESLSGTTTTYKGYFKIKAISEK